MKLKNIILTIIIVKSSLGFSQQSYTASYHEACGTVYADSMRRVKYPELGTLDQFENWLTQKTEEEKINRTSNGVQVSYTLPVIIHVIYATGDTIGQGANVSDEKIQTQMDVLNQCYKKQNPDVNYLSSPPYNSTNWATLAANCEISFCLTKTDTNGNIMPNPGVERIDAASKGINVLNYDISYIEDSIKPITIWDPSKYLNIWVVKRITVNGSAIVGYSSFPPSSTLPGLPSNWGTLSSDGVVLVYDAFGTVGQLRGNRNKGHTAVHEIGHYLGLIHPNGDTNCGNDYCADTPLQDALSGGCPAFPKISCNNGPWGDMFVNFMDYTADTCKFMFTNDQKTRVQTAMANSPYRISLTAQSCEINNSISEKNNSLFLEIYPNPAEDKLFVSSSENIERLKIYDLLGQSIINIAVNNTKAEINLRGYEKGVYFICIESERASITKRFIVK